LDWGQLSAKTNEFHFGDLLVMLTDRISFYMDAEVETDKPLPQPPRIMEPGQHTMTIKGAGFF